jgi:tetratricopeptide (TPR) repeat protein
MISYDKQTRNRRLLWFLVVLFVIIGMGGLGYLAAHRSDIQRGLEWRLDIAAAYLRGFITPARPVPTPAAVAQPATETRVSTPTSTPTVVQTPIGNISETPGASLPLMSPTPPASPTAALPARVALDSPTYEGQDWNNCGPAALAMQLDYYGWEGDQFTISDLIKPQRNDRNVNIDELAHYVRTRAGWLDVEYRVGGDIDLLRALLAAGFPVMIEETFHFEAAYWVNDDLWAGHYLLLTGYDDAVQTFTTQNSFIGPDLPRSYADLDASWQAFNRVYMLVYPAEQRTLVETILGQDWSPDDNRQRALDVARRESEAQPDNTFAWFNLGANQVYFEDYTAAAASFDQARQLEWPQRMLRYQFGPFLAYFHAGRTEDLLALAEYALERTPNSEEALLWRGWAHYRLDHTAAARADFQQALDLHPGYGDAQYALDFLASE